MQVSLSLSVSHSLTHARMRTHAHAHKHTDFIPERVSSMLPIEKICSTHKVIGANINIYFKVKFMVDVVWI